MSQTSVLSRKSMGTPAGSEEEVEDDDEESEVTEESDMTEKETEVNHKEVYNLEGTVLDFHDGKQGLVLKVFNVQKVYNIPVGSFFLLLLPNFCYLYLLLFLLILLFLLLLLLSGLFSTGGSLPSFVCRQQQIHNQCPVQALLEC